MTSTTPLGTPTKGPDRMPWLLAGTYVLVQVLIYSLGVRFDDVSLCDGAHNLDVELLRHNLLQSLFYLHSQPPLFNLFLGTVLKLFPLHFKLVFHCCYLICGLVLYFSLFYVQLRLGVGRWLAFSLSTLFVLSPPTIARQNEMLYTFPLTALLIASALLLHEFLAKQKTWLAFCFFFSLFLILGIRTLFHIFYFVIIAVMLMIFCRPNWRKVVLAALIPFLLILSIYSKNLIVFGTFSASSLLGMNVLDLITSNLSVEDRRQMVADGKVSELVLVDRFLALDQYPAKYRDVGGKTGIPALDEATKSTGRPNYNHLAYPKLSQQYLKDFLTLLKERPWAYVKGVEHACLLYIMPGIITMPFGSHRKETAFLESIYDTCFYGRLDVDLGLDHVSPFSLMPGYRFYVFLLFGFPILIAYGLVLSLRTQAKSVPLNRQQRIVVLYLCFNIIWVAVVGNLLELGDNNRFRFMTDPFYIVLLGLFIQFFVRTRLSRFLRKLRSSKPPTQNPANEAGFAG
ncbi:MAG: hypothetical protein JW759_07665 [Candidatus Coatesbacteria bacterium]|nr:hypothetical protein [Candidatus Coatesbacteria bacterium]